jgi:hypothetical protein
MEPCGYTVDDVEWRAINLAVDLDRSAKLGKPLVTRRLARRRRGISEVMIAPLPATTTPGSRRAHCPANPEARVLASKGVPTWFSDLVAKATNGEDTSAMVRAIHDASVHLGAQCVPILTLSTPRRPARQTGPTRPPRYYDYGSRRCKRGRSQEFPWLVE